MKEIYEALAAVTVVRELYDVNKDMYDVLAGYLKLMIISEHLKIFSCAEITSMINKNNSFKLNESVVKTALKRLKLEKKDGEYIVNPGFYESEDIQVLEDQNQQNHLLLENLYKYVQNEQGILLSDDDKEDVQEQFFNFLLNEETTDKYSLLISGYIMSISNDDNLMSIVNRIKEGTLIYEGICYNTDLSSLGKWTIELNIYLEQEILFYIVGYNGETHKSLYGQLIDYIKEVNNENKEHKKYIKLYYTQNVKNEIEAYFTAAEKAFENEDVIDPSQKPMLYILHGVKAKSDIQIKKVQFYNKLNFYDITLYEEDFYSKENEKYNKIDESVYQYNISHIDTERDADYIRKCTDKINQIEILRKNNNKGLKEVKHILLTANSTILKCAFSSCAYTSGDVPKATSLDFLINNLWFNLNKGFGKGSTPKNIDMVSRARMVLSLLSDHKISQSYDDIKTKYDNQEVTSKEVSSIIAELRRHSVSPDEINGEDIDEVKKFLNDYDVNEQIEEMKREEIARKEDQEKIVALEKEVENFKKEKKEEQAKYDKMEEQYKEKIEILERNDREISDKYINLESKIQELNEFEKEKSLKRKKRLRGILFFMCMIAVASIFFIAIKFIFSLDNNISGIISIALTVIISLVSPIKTLWIKFVKNCK